jgi:putative oxidoreductase
MRILSTAYKYREEGLLLLRIGIGLAFIFHGYPKIAGGVERWEKLGGAMGHLGLDFAPVFWGFMAAISEFVGGLLLMLGFLFRPVCVLLFITMVVALTQHLVQGDAFGQYNNSLKSAVVFASLFLMGPGRYSLDHYLFGPKERGKEDRYREAA